METLIWMFGFLVVLALIIGMADDRSSFLFASFKTGAQIWSQIFPLAALVIYFYCLMTNLFPGRWPYGKVLNLSMLFSQVELTVLFIAGSALFTRISNVVGIVLSFYAVQRMFFTPVLITDFTAGVAIFVSSLVIVSAMADCLPWVQDNSQKLLGDKLREIVILIFSFMAMASLFACFLKLNDFTSWLVQIDRGFNGHSRYILLTILLLFGGWIVVALGIARHVLIPIVALPTILAISFLTSWSPTVLFVLFVSILFMSLVRRRYLIMTTTRITYM